MVNGVVGKSAVRVFVEIEDLITMTPRVCGSNGEIVALVAVGGDDEVVVVGTVGIIDKVVCGGDDEMVLGGDNKVVLVLKGCKVVIVKLLVLLKRADAGDV